MLCFLEAHPKFDIFHCGVRIAFIKPAESHKGLSPYGSRPRPVGRGLLDTGLVGEVIEEISKT